MDNLESLIREYKSKITVKGPTNKKTIKQAEEELNLLFPNQLFDYLQNFGAISYHSMELTGLGYSKKSFRNIVHCTLEARKFTPIPGTSTVLEDIGEFHYAIVEQNGKVNLWNPKGSIEQLGKNVESYITMRIHEESE